VDTLERHVNGGVLRVRELVKSYGPVPVIDGVDLDVRPGETCALLGPSGCGKSTLLRVFAGFEEPDDGTVDLDGHAVTAPSPERGMVAQAGTLFPWLTLRQNLAFGPRETGAADVPARVDRLLADTGLADFADALPRTLSGGMRQRAAIAQVLANEPPVLLLDEPFGALDAQTRLRMHEWLRALLGRQDTTTVLVTHDVDEALLLADRLLLLSARPARITEEVDVALGDDRGRHTLSDPEFVRIKATVLDAVLTAPGPV